MIQNAYQTINSDRTENAGNADNIELTICEVRVPISVKYGEEPSNSASRRNLGCVPVITVSVSVRDGGTYPPALAEIEVRVKTTLSAHKLDRLVYARRFSAYRIATTNQFGFFSDLALDRVEFLLDCWSPSVGNSHCVSCRCKRLPERHRLTDS
ncbi:hypothetical protein WA026_014993 [Henosepilachna vigintioctopunctata]|uniref:Uncharacterized protein n=1 Tax=Henosepilachna vigintioctopunctata TaxID=420089 RepID=A0AAW1U9R8_9CUCU